MIPEREYSSFTHRTGWPWVVRHIRERVPLSDRIDDFVESTFGWDGGSQKHYDQNWIGIAHNPRGDHIMCHAIRRHPWVFMRTSKWKLSLPHLHALVVLSNWHADQLGKRRFQVIPLTHPTTFNHEMWNCEKWIDNRRIIQIGEWLRNTNILHEVAPERFRNLVIRQGTRSTKLAEEFRAEMKKPCLKADSVSVSATVDDQSYDKLLAGSVVLTEVYDTSANNAVLESIARATPHLINRHAATVEYLGQNYPGFYTRKEQIVGMLKDLDRILACHDYLREWRTQKRFQINTFIEQLTGLSEQCLR
jgi:hypothetical protein